MSLFDATVDLNPHQIEAVLFALHSSLCHFGPELYVHALYAGWGSSRSEIATWQEGFIIDHELLELT
jgi:hypothetical protein